MLVSKPAQLLSYNNILNFTIDVFLICLKDVLNLIINNVIVTMKIYYIIHILTEQLIVFVTRPFANDD